jgi:hypothetical protein
MARGTDERGWSRKFDEPIVLPGKGARQVVTLRDAGTYITKLPKAEHMASEWQAAPAGSGKPRAINDEARGQPALCRIV